MSAKDEAKSRKPYSVYLTPKAAWILEDFNRNSGFGSASRTFEEIVLAYNDIYEIINVIQDPRQLHIEGNPLTTLVSLPIIISLKQAINRLKKGLTTEEEVRRLEETKKLHERLEKAMKEHNG